MHFLAAAVCAMAAAAGMGGTPAAARNDKGPSGGCKKPCDLAFSYTEVDSAPGKTATGIEDIFNYAATDNKPYPTQSSQFTNIIYKGTALPPKGSDIGSLQGECFATAVDHAGEPTTAECQQSVEVDVHGYAGLFTYSGKLDYTAKTFKFAVTGGTGDLLGAYGTDTGSLVTKGGTAYYLHDVCIYLPKC